MTHNNLSNNYLRDQAEQVLSNAVKSLRVSVWCQEWTVRRAADSVALMRTSDRDVPAASHR